MKQGDTIYQVQAGNPSAEQYAIRIVSINEQEATLRAKYRDARSFKVSIEELHKGYTTANLSQQKEAGEAPQPDPKKKVTLPATPTPAAAPASDPE